MMTGSDRNSSTATKRPSHVVVARVAPHVREGVEPPADAAALRDGGGVDGLVLRGARRFRQWKAVGSMQRKGVGKRKGKVVENVRKGGGKHTRKGDNARKGGGKTQRKGSGYHK